MRVRMLGTGSSDGLPNPFCECATCSDARHRRRTRSASSAVLDDTVLFDFGPGAGPAAGRQGVSLRGIEHVLITHGHPDHLAPEFLLWRSWIHDLPELHVWGPREALERCAHWVSPDAPVRFHVVAPGDAFVAPTRTGDVEVRVIPSAHGHGNGDVYADEGVLFDVTSVDGDRLLYATDTGPLRDDTIAALRERAFTLVLIEETFGHADLGWGHLNLRDLADTLDRLRSTGAVTDSTDVVAFHLSHHNPPTEDLALALASIGVRTVDDGTVIDSRRGHHELVIGGARSGKSRYAESRATGKVTYVATGGQRPGDPEWQARVAEHRSRRPAHWRTIETTDLPTVLANAPRGETFLVDCIGMWLTARLDDADAWSDADDVRTTAISRVEVDVEDLLRALGACRANLLIVTNEVGQGVVPASRSGRLFRDLLGVLNTRLAAACDDTTFLVAGRPLATTDALPWSP